MVSKPRGTRDFDPAEMEKRRLVQTEMEEIFIRYGYKEIATPTIEHLELFELKSGDTIIDELYSFKDKGDRDPHHPGSRLRLNPACSDQGGNRGGQAAGQSTRALRPPLWPSFPPGL